MPYRVLASCAACRHQSRVLVGDWRTFAGIQACPACRRVVNVAPNLECLLCRSSVSECFDYSESLPHLESGPHPAELKCPACGRRALYFETEASCAPLTGSQPGPTVETAIAARACQVVCQELDLDATAVHASLGLPAAPVAEALCLPIMLDFRTALLAQIHRGEATFPVSARAQSAARAEVSQLFDRRDPKKSR